jgi:hypothetical protein
MRTRIFKLKRQRFLENAGGGTVFFTSEGGDRRHPTKFWQPGDVPEFEGDHACFEAEWVRLRGWRIVRRVHENGQPYEIQPHTEASAG